MAVQKTQMGKLVNQLALAEKVLQPTARDIDFDLEISPVMVRISAAEACIKEALLR